MLNKSEIISNLGDNYNKSNRGVIITGYFSLENDLLKKKTKGKKNYISSKKLISVVFGDSFDLNKLNNEQHKKIKELLDTVRIFGFRILDNIDNYNYKPLYVPDVVIIPTMKRIIKLSKKNKDKDKIIKHRKFLRNIKDSNDKGVKIVGTLSEGVDYCENRINKNQFYKDHEEYKSGYIIYTPRGSGKSDYLNSLQSDDEKKKYVDWCYLFNNLIDLKNIDKLILESDLKTINNVFNNIYKLARRNNLRLFTSRLQNIKPNAIVLIPWNKHKKNCNLREDDFNEVDALRLRIQAKEYAKKNKIPIFRSFKEATSYCERPSKTKVCGCIFIMLLIVLLFRLLLSNKSKIPKNDVST